MPFADSGGCRLHYESRGDKGSPLLMIAGYGASMAGWRKPVLRRLRERHRLILFDNRGVGNSDKPDEPYSMAQFADDAAAILDAAQIDAAHVFSTSMGGMIAQNLALRHPHRVRSLVLGCTTAADMDNPEVFAPAKDVLAILTAPRIGDSAQAIRNLWPILHSPNYLSKHTDLLEKELQERLQYPTPPQYALERQMQAVSNTHDVLDRLGELRQPALVITGTADILVPSKNSHLIARRIPNARLIEYPGAGHDFLHEAGDAATDDALEFFAQVDASRGYS